MVAGLTLEFGPNLVLVLRSIGQWLKLGIE